MNSFDFDPDQLRVRVAGSGPTVVCLHSSAGSSQQWEALSQTLAPDYRVVRVDAHGHGRSPEPTPGLPVFAQDVQRLAPLLAGSAGGVHLVGHSYGGALAVCLALAHPQWVRSLVLYEPVLFSLLDDPVAPRAAREEIQRVGNAIVAAAAAGEPQRAAQVFMDYWAGDASWDTLGEKQQASIVARMPVVAGHFESMFASGVTPAMLQAVHVPTLLLSGGRTRPAAAAVVEIVAVALPDVARERFADLGHLGPITHPARVNESIARFIDAVQAELDDATPAAIPAQGGIRPAFDVLSRIAQNG